MTNKISALSQFRNACRPYVNKLTGVAASLVTAKVGGAIIGGSSAANAVGGSAALNASVQAGTISGLAGTGAGSVLPNMLPLVDPAFTALNQVALNQVAGSAAASVTGNVASISTVGTSAVGTKIGVIGSGVQIAAAMMDISLGIPVSVLVAGTAVAGRKARKIYQEHKRLPQNSQNISRLEADAKKETPLLTSRAQNTNTWNEFLKNHEKKIAFLACLSILVRLGINDTDYLRELLTTDNPYKFMHLIREFPLSIAWRSHNIPDLFKPEHLENHIYPATDLSRFWLPDALSFLGTMYLWGRCGHDCVSILSVLAKKLKRLFPSLFNPPLPPDYAKPLRRANFGIVSMIAIGSNFCILACLVTIFLLVQAKKRKEPLDPNALSHLIDFFNAPSKETFGDGIEQFKFSEESPNRGFSTTGEYKKKIAVRQEPDSYFFLRTDISRTYVGHLHHPHAMKSIEAEYPTHRYSITVPPQIIRYQPSPKLYKKNSHRGGDAEPGLEHTNVAHRFSNLMTHKFRVPEKLVQTVDGQEIGTLVEMDTKKYGAYKCFQSSRQEHPPINCYAEEAWKKWLSVNELAHPASSIRPLTSREQVEKFRLNYRFFD